MSSASDRNVVVGGVEIDAKLLEPRAWTRCDLARCQAGCCADGVWVDVAQADAIRANAARIQPFLPEERRDPATWFEAQVHDDDPAFPSGRYVGTTTVVDPSHPSGTTCVFLRPGTRWCAIQSASMEAGRDAWELKPLYCCMFPVVDELEDEDGERLPRRRVTLDDENSLFERGGGCHQPASDSMPAFQVYAEETALAIGVEAYRELCRLRGVEPRL
jgi:Fe-S-cluster containining protein